MFADRKTQSEAASVHARVPSRTESPWSSCSLSHCSAGPAPLPFLTASTHVAVTPHSNKRHTCPEARTRHAGEAGHQGGGAERAGGSRAPQPPRPSAHSDLQPVRERGPAGSPRPRCRLHDAPGAPLPVAPRQLRAAMTDDRSPRPPPRRLIAPYWRATPEWRHLLPNASGSGRGCGNLAGLDAGLDWWEVLRRGSLLPASFNPGSLSL